MMPTVVWNSDGFHLIDVLPKGSKLNAGHDISHILLPLREILAPSQDASSRHFVIHADNIRRHWAKAATLFLDRNSLRRAAHLLYSPDLASLGFLLFEYLKGVLQGSSFDESDEFLSVIQEILRESIGRLWMPHFKNE
jgi:hypothetical protein